MKPKVQVIFFVVFLMGACSLPTPDSAGHYPPPPGLSYGGIPYGSMSGNVAEYFKRNAPSISRSGNYDHVPIPNFAPIEQWL